ncbi:hypothetical protein OG978_48020 (plasmid) [Streptomyces sp. NBC_01591]|uniref:hypothetical protein n=1 Tax=Streptomyces sp. NBC_01591 TaxID=2975888 RepID=UPI002DDADF6F|nr:hypothetical protein [Streptomyces sp. NBC_01591]WSD74730.1 hypothetical protein OG978_48020 [Streptomyces sp. NBC_01591]
MFSLLPPAFSSFCKGLPTSGSGRGLALLLLGDTGLADEFVSLGAGGVFGGEVGGRAQVTLSESCTRGT